MATHEACGYSKQALAAVLAVLLAGNAFVFGIPAAHTATTFSDIAIVVLIFVVPSVTVSVLGLASVFVGSRRMNPRLVAFTLRAAIVDYSRRELGKDIARLQAEVAALEPPVAVEQSERKNSRLKHLLQFLSS